MAKETKSSAPEAKQVVEVHGKQAPSLGRIVLYTEEDGTQSPGIVVKVHNVTCVNLRTFQDSNQQHFQARLDVVEGTSPGTWMWPPRG